MSIHKNYKHLVICTLQFLTIVDELIYFIPSLMTPQCQVTLLHITPFDSSPHKKEKSHSPAKKYREMYRNDYEMFVDLARSTSSCSRLTPLVYRKERTDSWTKHWPLARSALWKTKTVVWEGKVAWNEPNRMSLPYSKAQENIRVPHERTHRSTEVLSDKLRPMQARRAPHDYHSELLEKLYSIAIQGQKILQRGESGGPLTPQGVQFYSRLEAVKNISQDK